MTPEERQLLNEKKKYLQRKNRAQEFAVEAIQPCLEIIDRLLQAGISYEIVAVTYIAEEHQPFLDSLLQKEPFSNYALYNVPKMEDNPFVDELMKSYPNKHPFRYVPDLPQYDFWFEIKDLIHKHSSQENEVYVCFLQFALVFKVHITEFVEKATEEILNSHYGDMVIFPDNHDWLLIHSINDFWQFGNKTNQVH